MRCIEDICVFYKKAPKYNPQGLKKIENPKVRNNKMRTDAIYRKGLAGEYKQRYTNYPKNILEYGYDAERLHPTQKPVALLEYLIKTYTDEGETVLDNCMGSGSTGVACANTNRRFVGIELSDHYFGVAKHRIENARAM